MQTIFGHSIFSWPFLSTLTQQWPIPPGTSCTFSNSFLLPASDWVRELFIQAMHLLDYNLEKRFLKIWLDFTYSIVMIFVIGVLDPGGNIEGVCSKNLQLVKKVPISKKSTIFVLFL